jgi:hypothetical protein
MPLKKQLGFLYTFSHFFAGKTTKYCIFLLSEGKISVYCPFKQAPCQEEGRGPP